jgi:hypothetical protein
MLLNFQYLLCINSVQVALSESFYGFSVPMNALCITKGKACLCVSLHNHQFCLVHDACEMSPIILGTKFIKKQYNLNFPKDCRWKL